MPAVEPQIAEVLEITGLTPDIFNFDAVDDLNAMLERRMAFARGRTKRGVGATAWASDDEDVQMHIRSAIAYRLLAMLLQVCMNQKVTGTNAPLLFGDVSELREAVEAANDQATDDEEQAQLSAPTTDLPRLDAVNAQASTTAKFKRADTW